MSHRVLENLCSGHEVNKKLTKQHDCCFLFYDFDLRASHARTLLPAALASVSFGFVLVRVRVRVHDCCFNNMYNVAKTSWKRLTFYKCDGRKLFDLDR